MSVQGLAQSRDELLLEVLKSRAGPYSEHRGDVHNML